MAPEQKTRKSARYGWVEGKGSVSIENRFHWKLDGYIDRYAQVSLVAVCHKVRQHNMKIIGIISEFTVIYWLLPTHSLDHNGAWVVFVEFSSKVTLKLFIQNETKNISSQTLPIL